MAVDRAKQVRERNQPFSSKSVPSKDEQTREFVNSLVLNYRLVDPPKTDRNTKPSTPGRDLAGRDLELYEILAG